MFRLLILLAALLPTLALAQLSDGFESPAPVEPVEPQCSVPAGFTVVEKRWEDIFYGISWPNSPSYMTPIGSWSYRDSSAPYGKPAAGRILTARIVADDKMHRISFAGVQPVPYAYYPLAQAAVSSTVTLSTCRADMFAPCQITARSGSLFYGPTASVPECRVTSGETYWISWHNAQPDFSPATNSCKPNNPSKGVRCDSNFSSR